MESFSFASNVDPSLLVIIIDTNHESWQDHHKRMATSDLKLNFETLVKALSLFVQSYLLLNRDNHLIVIASCESNSPCQVIFPSVNEQTANDNKPSPISIQSQLIDKLFLKPATTKSNYNNQNSSLSGLSVALSTALCMINKQMIKTPKIQTQILITQISDDNASSYNQIMNSIFSAHKLNILIDSLVLTNTDSTFLQVCKLELNSINTS